MRFVSIKRLRHCGGVAGVLSAMVVGGCNGLTDVQATDVVVLESLAGAKGAATLYAGAVGTFAMAFVGNAEAHFIATGLFTDEFIAVGPKGSVWSDYDLRQFPSDRIDARLYNNVQKSRITTLQAIRALQANAPEPKQRIGELFAYAGYTEIFLGETMCSGIPLSDLVNQEPVFGEQLTLAQMFERAVASFDSALAYAGGDAKVANLARVGRGRALLNLAQFDEASAAVDNVPTDFRFQVEINAQASSESNGYYYGALRTSTPWVTIQDRDGENGLDYISSNDPRLGIVFVSATGAQGLPFYEVTKYKTMDAPVELASGIEARLIQAEAAYQRDPDNSAPVGNSWLGILNALRATAITPSLPLLTDPGSPAARVDMLFREKAFWTYATGRRMGDMRRLVRQYGRDSEKVFPTGKTIYDGIFYGTDVNLAPFRGSQDNNPNYKGCIDRKA